MLKILLLLLGIIGFPLIILVSPLILLFRFGNRHGPKIGVAVSASWPYYLQYLRIPYDFAVWRAGGKTMTIAPSDLPDLENILDKVDGIILTGGEDIDPQLHDGTPTAHHLLNSKRDQLELKILDKNEELDLPLLCICRGFQLLAVHKGGHLKDLKQHKLKIHPAKILPDTKMYEILQKDSLRILSIHHQSAGAAGDLEISAFSIDDDNIECIECPKSYWTIGTQWHSELMSVLCRSNQRIFDTLIKKATAKKRPLIKK
jgi:putative glutamine amidotransferase